MADAVKSFFDDETIKELIFSVIRRNERWSGAVRCEGNHNPLSLNILHTDLKFKELKHKGLSTFITVKSLIGQTV